MRLNPNVITFIHKELARLAQAIRPQEPCDRTAVAEVMLSYGNAVVEILEWSPVDFNKQENLVPFVSILQQLSSHSRDLIGPIGQQQCGIRLPEYLPSGLYKRMLERLHKGNVVGDLSKRVLKQYDATCVWPREHDELALGQHRRIGYRHASLMGVETEGPAPQGGLVLAASH